jgi:RNA polymerase sigma factor (sigma-70 family)
LSAVIDSSVVGAQSLGYRSDGHLLSRSDEDLVSRLRAHDDGAFAVLVTRYERQLLAFCRRILGSREDAEDVLQDTFAAAYKAILADERVIECRPWLYQIARNRCLNAIRGRRPTQPLRVGGLEREAPLGTAEQVARKLELRLLVGDILALPDQQREALVLQELEGWSYEQIAHHLGASVASVRSLLLRARRTLLALAEGRALPCAEVRMRLAEPSDPSAAMRRHLDSCSDCARYRRRLKRRPAHVLRAVSPLGLLVGLRDIVLPRVLRRAAPHAAAGGAGAGGAATAGAGGVATAGAGVSAVVTKALAGLAVLAAAGTGTVVVQQVTTGGQRHAGPPARVQPGAALPAQSASPVVAPAPPTWPLTPSARSHRPQAAPKSTPTSGAPTTPSGVPPAPSSTSAGQGAQGAAPSQTTSTPATAGRGRPVPGAGMGSSRTRPLPVQAQNSPPSGSSGPSSGQDSPSGTDSGQSSQTGTPSGPGSTTSSSGQSSPSADPAQTSPSSGQTSQITGDSTQTGS